MGVDNGMPCAIMDCTKIAVNRFLVDDVATMPIFLKDSCIAAGRKQSLALPKPDVTDSKLYNTSGAMLRRERILDNA